MSLKVFNRIGLLIAMVILLTATPSCRFKEQIQKRIARVESIHAARVARCEAGTLGSLTCATLDRGYEQLKAVYRILNAADATRGEIKLALEDLEWAIEQEQDALLGESAEGG